MFQLASKTLAALVLVAISTGACGFHHRYQHSLEGYSFTI